MSKSIALAMRLVELCGVKTMLLSTMRLTIETFRAALMESATGQMLAPTRQEVEEILKSAENAAGDLLLSIGELYSRKFTEEEMEALILFYESPIGKALMSKAPELTREAMELGTKWGKSLEGKIEQLLQ